MKKQLIITADGSHSFYLKEMDEHYHSKHGSIAESKHIFITAGLMEVAKKKQNIRIFEVGMGTGLNVYLTALKAAEEKLKIEMHTIEAFPIDEEEVRLLNYTEQMDDGTATFDQIHQLEWGRTAAINESVQLKKIHAMLQDHVFDTLYDLIYFDAFAPEKQEEMWSEHTFRRIYDAMCSNGILVTYCVKGMIRRRLQAIGFAVEKIAGPKGGKREMLRAIKGGVNILINEERTTRTASKGQAQTKGE